MTSWQLSTRVHETVKNMGRASDSVQTPQRKVHEGAVGAFGMKKRKFVEAGRGYPVRGGMSFFGTNVRRC